MMQTVACELYSLIWTPELLTYGKFQRLASGILGSLAAIAVSAVKQN